MDYKKLHKDTIAKLQEMVNSGKITVETACGICADFVPESEDERIRKKIIQLVNDAIATNAPYKKEMLFWLEKQGEHANFRNKIQIGDQVTKNQDGVLVNMSQLKRVAKSAESKKHDVCNNCEQQGSCVSPCPMKLVEKQGEQKPADTVEPKFKVGDWIQPKDPVLGEPRIIERIYPTWGYDTNKGILDFEFEDNWELVERKPAWSEEDEKKRKRIMHRLSIDGTINNKDLADINDWLKSLRPQTTWRPSDEQMEALKGVQEGVFRLGILESLYQDLKKLREE